MNKKCIITRYDESIKEPPYLTVPIDSMEVEDPEVDNFGEEFYRVLLWACRSKGYQLRFYTTWSKTPEFDYEVVVY